MAKRAFKAKVESMGPKGAWCCLPVPLDLKAIFGYLSQALSRNKNAKNTYAKLAYSHQKRYAEWVGQAKTDETRQRRMEKMMKMLAAGKTID